MATPEEKEKGLETEELAEVKELNEAAAYLKDILNGKGLPSHYEKAAGLVSDAEKHNERLAAFAHDLISDFSKGGGRVDSLTADEQQIFVTTLNISRHLSSIVANINAAKRLIPTAHFVTSPGYITAHNYLTLALNELTQIVQQIRGLFVLEKQVDELLSRAT
jgi:hypothetical protein